MIAQLGVACHLLLILAQQDRLLPKREDLLLRLRRQPLGQLIAGADRKLNPRARIVDRPGDPLAVVAGHHDDRVLRVDRLQNAR